MVRTMYKITKRNSLKLIRDAHRSLNSINVNINGIDMDHTVYVDAIEEEELPHYFQDTEETKMIIKKTVDLIKEVDAEKAVVSWGDTTLIVMKQDDSYITVISEDRGGLSVVLSIIDEEYKGIGSPKADSIN